MIDFLKKVLDGRIILYLSKHACVADHYSVNNKSHTKDHRDPTTRNFINDINDTSRPEPRW